MSRFLPARRVAWACFSSALWAALASGCIESLVVDRQPASVTARDADVENEEEADAAEPIGEPDPIDQPTRDASRPGLDAGAEPGPKPDAGRDAGREAGPPAVQDAGSKPDAGCTGGRCDAGSGIPNGPCAACGGVAVLAQPAGTDMICDNGSPTVCWENPVGECTMQCPNTESCSKDQPFACGLGRYCYFAKSDCGASSPGFCATARKDCDSLSVPVCGCDGKIHQNTCLAAAAGTAVYTGLATDHCR